MPRVRRCAVCGARGPNYFVMEQNTRRHAYLCMECIRRVGRLVSRSRDLARSMEACRRVALDYEVAMARGTGD